MRIINVREPLRDQIGRSLYEEGHAAERADWYSLSEVRREPWRADADRCLSHFAAFLDGFSNDETVSAVRAKWLAALRGDPIAELDEQNRRRRDFA